MEAGVLNEAKGGKMKEKKGDEETSQDWRTNSIIGEICSIWEGVWEALINDSFPFHHGFESRKSS